MASILGAIILLGSCSSSPSKKFSVHPCKNLLENSCHNLGVKLVKAEKVAMAKDVFLYNCTINNMAQSCVNAGVLSYNEGDKNNAKHLYDKACDQNFALACSNRGCFDDPYGKCGDSTSKREIDVAISYYMKSCHLGGAVGCYNLAGLFLRQNKFKLSEEFYKRSCALGDKDACSTLKSR